MRFLIPFFDDSSLMFAARMRNLLAARSWAADLVYFLDKSGEPTLSERQMQLHGVPMSDPLPGTAFRPMLEQGYDGVLACRVPAFVSEPLQDSSYLARRDRPCFIAFQPGLEFTPRRGFESRSLFDTIFLNCRDHLDVIGPAVLAKSRAELRFGHPYFLRPAPDASPRGQNVYFFAQAISPTTRAARQHIVDVLIALAEANPDRKVVLKLRHLPHENQLHVHRERYSYPDLIEARGEPLPTNMQYSVCSMAEALADAAVCLTCTSTAAMDAVSGGVPVLVYTGFVDYWKDRMSAAMEREFEGSGLVASLDEVLNLDVRAPRPGWLKSRFVTADGLLDDVSAAVTQMAGSNGPREAPRPSLLAARTSRPQARRTSLDPAVG